MTRVHDVPDDDAEATCQQVVEIITDYLENAFDPASGRQSRRTSRCVPAARPS